MPRSIVDASSAAPAAPPPCSTRFVGEGPHGEPPGWVACPVDRAPAPASAAELRSWTTASATPPAMSATRRLRDALHVERARQRQRGGGRVVEADQRRRDLRAEPARERAAALGVGEAVVRERGEELQQQPDGLGLEHDRVGAGAELRERLRARPSPRRGARAPPGRARRRRGAASTA